jgi:hypothetical protein
MSLHPRPAAGCDKNMPGTLIAMSRLNRPSLMIYGGTIKPGHAASDNATLDIVSAFQSYGAAWAFTVIFLSLDGCPQTYFFYSPTVANFFF